MAEADERRRTLQEKFFAAKAERNAQLEELGVMGKGGQQSERLAEMEKAISTLEELVGQRRRIRDKLVGHKEKLKRKKDFSY